MATPHQFRGEPDGEPLRPKGMAYTATRLASILHQYRHQQVYLFAMAEWVRGAHVSSQSLRS